MPSVTRKSQTRRAARRDEIIEQLLIAVESMLEEGEGFTEMSVERLVTSAGISRSTFYVYFEDKGDLLLALTEDVVRRLVEAAAAWWQLPPEATKDDLRGALAGVISAYMPHQLLWGAVVDASSYDQRVRERFRDVVELAAAAVAKHIRDGQKTGTVRDDLDPKRTGEFLTWMTERGLYQLFRGATEAEVKKLCQAQTDIVWYTLYDGAKTPDGKPRRVKGRRRNDLAPA